MGANVGKWGSLQRTDVPLATLPSSIEGPPRVYHPLISSITTTEGDFRVLSQKISPFHGVRVPLYRVSYLILKYENGQLTHILTYSFAHGTHHKGLSVFSTYIYLSKWAIVELGLQPIKLWSHLLRPTLRQCLCSY